MEGNKELGIEELNRDGLKMLEQVAQLSKEFDYEKVLNQFEVISLDDEEYLEIIKDRVTGKYWKVENYYEPKLLEVFPTEITKIVYLPKELI